MRVLAWNQNLTDERARDAGATRVAKDTLIREADFVSVSLKLSGRTRHIFGAAEFTLMKRTACSINTSRGPLVDAMMLGRCAGGARSIRTDSAGRCGECRFRRGSPAA